MPRCTLAFGAHKLGYLPAVRPHVFLIRSGSARFAPCLEAKCDRRTPNSQGFLSGTVLIFKGNLYRSVLYSEGKARYGPIIDRIF